MSEQALIVASFGTSVPEARRSISAVEEALAAAAPGYAFVRAFTSPTIRRILKSGGRVWRRSCGSWSRAERGGSICCR